MLQFAAVMSLISKVMVTPNVDTTKSSSNRHLKGLQNAEKSHSLISYSQSLRVEPLCLMDRTVSINPIAYDLMQFVHSSFSGFYLQAMAMDDMVGEIDVKSRVEKYNPNRHRNMGDYGATRINGGIKLSTETFEVDRLALEADSYQDRVAWRDDERQYREEMRDEDRNYKYGQKYDDQIYAEKQKQDERQYRQAEKMDERQYRNSEKQDERKYRTDEKINEREYREQEEARRGERDDQRRMEDRKFRSEEEKARRLAGQQLGPTDQAVKEIKEETNLGIGKLITVDLHGKNGTKLRLPVAIKINAWSLSPKEITDVLTFKQNSPAMKERIHLWKKGHLSFWKDIVFCRDLIARNKKDMIAEKNGIIRSEVARQINNKMRTIDTGKAGAAELSNIVIISKDTQIQLEAAISGRLDMPSVREKIFNSSGIMMLMVVDTEYDRVKVYYQSVSRASDLTFREIKASSKDSSSNIGDIMQSLLLSQPPRL